MGLLCFHKFTWNQEIFSSKHNYCILETMLHQNMHIFLFTKMMMMKNYFCRMIDQQKVLSLTSSQDHCQRFSPLWISDMAVNKIWTCTETEFKLCRMKLCSSDNNYNLALDFWSCHLSTIKSWICSSETLTW